MIAYSYLMKVVERVNAFKPSSLGQPAKTPVQPSDAATKLLLGAYETTLATTLAATNVDRDLLIQNLRAALVQRYDNED